MACKVRGCDQSQATAVIPVGPPDGPVMEVGVCEDHRLQLAIGDRWSWDAVTNEIVTDVATLPRLKTFAIGEGSYTDAGAILTFTLFLSDPSGEDRSIAFDVEPSLLRSLSKNPWLVGMLRDIRDEPEAGDGSAVD